MKISLLVDAELISTDVVDPNDVFNPAIRRNYTPDVEIRQGDYIYKNIAGLIEIPLLSTIVDPDNTLQMNDIVYDDVTDNVLKKVTSIGEKFVPKQPEDYVAVDTSKLSGDWTHRYVKLFDNFPTENSYVVETRTHTFTLGNGLIEQEVDAYGSFKTVYHEQIDNMTLEEHTEVSASNNWRYHFNTLILRGTALYGIANIKQDIEYDSVTTAQLTPIVNITDIDGFVMMKAALHITPLDDKHYTKATKFESMAYTLKAGWLFDTVCLGRVIADNVSGVFKDSGGTQVGSTVSIPIDNRRDIDGRLPEYPATSILYSSEDVELGGSIELSLSRSSKNIELGSIQLGVSVSAGMTNLKFSNAYGDYSPFSRDTWGYITYIDGVKTRILEGTVDIETGTYDIIDRLLNSITGTTVIINASNLTDNTAPDNVKTFGATMLQGRMRDLKLAPNQRHDAMSKLSTYSFVIEEQV